jgi:hypothetical protein
MALMKLYTEEQVRLAMYFARGHNKMTDSQFIDLLIPIELPSDSLCINCDESESTHNICMDCIIKIGKENIQLPSDEEIEEKAKKVGGGHYPFICGAKWVINKIQGGNND